MVILAVPKDREPTTTWTLWQKHKLVVPGDLDHILKNVKFLVGVTGVAFYCHEIHQAELPMVSG